MNDHSFDPRQVSLDADELAGRVIAITGRQGSGMPWPSSAQDAAQRSS